MQLDDFSDLVFRLTNVAVEQPLESDQDELINILRDYFPIDAAWWGWSSFSGGRTSLINTGLHNLPQSFESAVRAVIHLDPLVQIGRNLTVFSKVIDVQNSDLPKEYKACLAAFQIKSILNGHCRLQGQSEFNFFLSLYIGDGGRQHTETNERDFRAVLRHIEQNLSLSLRSELRRLAPHNGEAAFLNVGGSIVRATSGFKKMLSDEGCTADTITNMLRDMSFKQRQHRYGALVLESAMHKRGLVLARVSRSDALVRLSTEERRLSELLVKGLTMRQAAAEKGVSHNTIRNQVSTIYRKLNVHNRVALVRKLEIH